MPMNAQIGALRVSLGLDTAQFQQGVKRTRTGMDGLAAAAAVAFAAVAAAAGGAFLAIRAASERADEAWKSSQAIGVPIRDLGRLQYAAKMSGIEFDQLKKGLKETTAVIKDAASGVKNDATKALNGLGVSVKNADGSLRSTNDIIGDVADSFAKMPNGVGKTSAAMAIFGKKVGPDLIPLLNEGRAGIQKLGDEAERLGLVFDEKTARASEVFNDNLERISLVLTGLWNRVLANVVPAFAALSGKFFEASQTGGALDTIVQGISIAVNAMARVVGFAFDHLNDLYDLFKVFVAAKIISFVFGVGQSFIALAKTIRLAGLATALVTSLLRLKITALAILAAVIAKVTGLYDPLIAKLGELGQAVADALPASVRETFTDMSGGILKLGDYITGVTNDVGLSEDEFISLGDSAAGSFGDVTKSVKGLNEGLDTVRDRIATAMAGIKEVANTVGGAISGVLSGIVKDSVRGVNAIDGVINKFGDLGDRLIDMAFDQAIQAAVSMLLGAFTGGGLGVGKGLTGAATYGFTGNGVYGVPGLATGGRLMSDGLVEVGERGRELLALPRGAQVMRGNSNLGSARGGRVRLELGQGLVASVLDESARQSVEIVQAYDSKLSTSVADKRRRGGLGF
jgi:hypothetical protein